MTRRTFCRLLAGGVGAAAAGAWGLLRRASPKRVLAAVRATVYPGGKKPLDGPSIGRTGAWRG